MNLSKLLNFLNVAHIKYKYQMESTPYVSDAGRIDYSNTPPISFKKTATLVNYFIINTAQFLNTFSQVAEGKLNEVDDKLD